VGLWDSIRRLFGGHQPGSARDTPTARSQPPDSWHQPEAEPPPAVRRPALVKRWSLPDDLLQFSSSRPAGQVVDIVVGFDFGTSSSKIILQTPYKLGARAIPVDFGPLGHKSLPWLLPSSVTEHGDGRIALGQDPRGDVLWRDLKIRLLGDGRSSGQRRPATDDHLARAAAYVGLALRAARHFFLTNAAERQNYLNDHLRWSLNVGIPSAGYDDQPIRDRFALVARAGWLLSLAEPAPTVAMAMDATVRARAGNEPGVEVAVIPEVAAEVVGYAKSRQRRDGLHFILDVGASTIDLCAFVLHSDRGDDVYELLSADVRQLGLLALHDARMQACGGRAPFDRWPDDLAESIPEWESLPHMPAEARRLLQHADDGYVNTAARQVLLRMIDYVRHHRDPNTLGWQTGVPLFLCGGGSGHQVVPRVVSLAESTGRKNWTGYRGLKVTSLPVPRPLVSDLPEGLFQRRLAVAHGLSFPGINIGPINPPHSIENVDAPDRLTGGKWQERFVGKDQV
jgi:hypothetical protein